MSRVPTLADAERYADECALECGRSAMDAACAHEAGRRRPCKTTLRQLRHAVDRHLRCVERANRVHDWAERMRLSASSTTE